MISPLFDPNEWTEVTDLKFEDITFHKATETGAVRIAFNRPDLRNAFRPQTVDELLTALEWSHRQNDVGVILLTGNGPSSKDGGWAFCSGGDQNVRGKAGYEYKDTKPGMPVAHGRLHILEVQRMIRFMPKVVIALVPGWAVGGGHSLHVVCDMTIASREHAIFMQSDANVASFDGGFGSAYLARQVGQKRAREVFFLEQKYSAEQAFQMGMVNKVVPHAELEKAGLEWADIICQKSPTAIKMLKFGFNLIDDGLVGQQVYAGEATRLAYGTEEAQEGRNAFLQKRKPEFDKFPWVY
jgi:naphthoate synthase